MATNIDSNSLSFLAVGQSICESDKRSVTLRLDFSVSTQYTLNLQNMQARNFIGMIRAVFVDNTSATFPLTINNSTTKQTLQVPIGEQGYLNLLCPNPCSLTFTSTSNLALFVTLLNYETDNYLWTQ